MKLVYKIASSIGALALALVSLTSCEGSEMYGVDSPGWISNKVDSIANSKSQGDDDDALLEGLEEDVYNIGKEDLTAGFWTLGKTYVIPAGEIWQAQFKLTVNPDNKYFKNFYIVLNQYNGAVGDEFGVIRFDNDPTKNSEWNTTGTEIDRSLIGGNFKNSSGDDDIDGSVQGMNGKITITVNRGNGGLFIEMTNGELTKTYTQTSAFPSTGAENDICCRIGVEGSFVSFLGSNIEPIGGFTSKEDKQPLAIKLSGVAKKVLQGTTLEDLVENVVATVEFEQGVSKEIPASELTFQAVPDMFSMGKKTLVAAYAKTFKGEAASTPVIGTADFEIVDKMYKSIGATDNSGAFWSDHSDAIKVGAGETFVSYFTNYTDGGSNWNNFLVVLATADGTTEYAVLRADNYGWGNGYAACTAFTESDRDWGTWLSAMDGAKVTTYVTNNGDGTADVKYVMLGNDGNTYTQEYVGINTVDPDNFYFHFTIEKAHLEFDTIIGDENNTGAFWSDHSENIQVPAGKTYAINFTNFTNGGANWNNFLVALTSEDRATEYAILRADNYGWGDGYAACMPATEPDRDWTAWLSAMDGAKVTAYVTNNGDGTADVKCVMMGNDGVTYTQEYIGINTIDPDNFCFHFTLEKAHLVFE